MLSITRLDTATFTPTQTLAQPARLTSLHVAALMSTLLSMRAGTSHLDASAAPGSADSMLSRVMSRARIPRAESTYARSVTNPAASKGKSISDSISEHSTRLVSSVSTASPPGRRGRESQQTVIGWGYWHKRWHHCPKRWAEIRWPFTPLPPTPYTLHYPGAASLSLSSLFFSFDHRRYRCYVTR